jgi:hypothetical protein
LVGQRRTGKSYILRQIAHRLIEGGVDPRNIFYVNKEFTDFDFISDYKDLEALLKLYREKLKPEGKVWLFIDEVQNIIGWEHFVNSHSQDFVESYEIFISGSNSKMLSMELATLLSGRYVNFEVFPFSYAEYIGITQKEVQKQSYIDYMESGALPELFVLPNDETKRNYISAIKDTVLLRDIIQRHSIKDPKLLEDVFVYLVNNASNLVSIVNIVNYFKSNGRKTTYDTVANYISYIENTFMIHNMPLIRRKVILKSCRRMRKFAAAIGSTVLSCMSNRQDRRVDLANHRFLSDCSLNSVFLTKVQTWTYKLTDFSR